MRQGRLWIRRGRVSSANPPGGKSEGHRRQGLTCVHLPDVDGAVGAAHHQVVVGRTPLDDLDGEEVARGQHDALPLPEAEQAHRVVAGHGADAVLHPGLQGAVDGGVGKEDEEKKCRNESSRFVFLTVVVCILPDWSWLNSTQWLTLGGFLYKSNPITDYYFLKK